MCGCILRIHNDISQKKVLNIIADGNRKYELRFMQGHKDVLPSFLGGGDMLYHVPTRLLRGGDILCHVPTRFLCGGDMLYPVPTNFSLQ